MKDEYIIINKTAIQKRIEELERDPIHSEWEHNIKTHNGHSPQQRERKKMVDLELGTLKEILHQSTPLTPVLQKTWNTAYIDAMPIDEETYKPLFFEDYISNLKLDI